MSIQSAFSTFFSLFRSNTASIFSDCPGDIIAEIMQRLSTKDAVSFQATSKKMRAVFIDPSFPKIRLEAKATNLLFKKIMETTSKPINPFYEKNVYFLVLGRFSSDHSDLTLKTVDRIPKQEEISGQFALKVTIKKTDSSRRHQISQIGFPKLKFEFSQPDLIKKAFENLNEEISTKKDLMFFDFGKASSSPSSLDSITSWLSPPNPQPRPRCLDQNSVFNRLGL